MSHRRRPIRSGPIRGRPLSGGACAAAALVLVAAGVLSACSDAGPGIRAAGSTSETAPDATAGRRTAEEADPQARFWRLVRTAREHLGHGDGGAAADSFGAALEIRPDHGDSLYYLAQIRYERGDPRGAEDLLLRLTRAEPGGVRAWQQLAVLYGTPMAGWRPDLRAAIAATELALRANPENSGTHLLHARWAAYSGRPELARASLQRALGLYPASPAAWRLALWITLRWGQPDEVAELGARARVHLCGDGARGCPQAPALDALLRAAAEGRADGVMGVPVGGSTSYGNGGPAYPSTPEPDVLGGDGGLSARVDLDGDGSPDLVARAKRGGEPARLFARAGGAWRLLPHDAAGAGAWLAGAEASWPETEASTPETAPQPADVEASSRGPWPVPWRGVFLDDETGLGLLLIGGGDDPVRLYGVTDGTWKRVQAQGLPSRLAGAVVASADWDGDGLSDLFLANVVGEEGWSNPAGRAASGPASELGGRLFRRLAFHRFEPSETEVPDRLSAAVALDVEGDGDADLLFARVPIDPVDGYLVGETGVPATATGRLEPASVALWLNRGGRLAAAPDAVPALRAAVQDLVATDLDGDRLPDLFIATGGLSPEQAEPDLLWRNDTGRFVEPHTWLTPSLPSATLRAWEIAPRRLLLLRGGIVPAAPSRVLELRPAPEDRRPQ